MKSLFSLFCAFFFVDAGIDVGSPKLQIPNSS